MLSLFFSVKIKIYIHNSIGIIQNNFLDLCTFNNCSAKFTAVIQKHFIKIGTDHMERKITFIRNNILKTPGGAFCSIMITKTCAWFTDKTFFHFIEYTKFFKEGIAKR